ncbi:MAG: ankyrin repeat domain-containing protein [Alphaproteobacteria bacterium]|nr:ankyrin repeat domain-containing protein [Alphaproteobacteria bacterium]
MNALYHDDFSTVDNLLKQGVNVNLPYNHNGWTPFMWVCKEHCNPEIIGKFLICDGKVDKTNNHGKTPLHIMAAHRCSFDCLQILIAHGANPNAQDEDGNTALHIAAAHPQADIRMDVVWNLFLKTDDTILNNDGKTAYDLAKENPNFTDEEVLKIMKESCDE